MVCKEDVHELLYRIFGIETTSKQNPKADHMAKKAQEAADASANSSKEETSEKEEVPAVTVTETSTAE